MALPEHNEPPQFDFRVYVGIIFFRWQIIALFFLYSLLGGILFIHLSPKIYQTSCNLLIYKDPSYQVSEATVDARWMDSHRYLLQGSRLRLRVVDRLAEAWSQPMGGRGKMALPVTVYQVHSLGPTLNVSIKGPIPAYNEAFLTTLLEEHKAEWRSVQMESTESASRLLEKELVLLEEKIRKSEDDLIEYQRLHDIARVSARGTMESAYLGALMGRRNQLTTELMLLEAQTPVLKEVNAGVLRHVGLLTRETGAVRPAADREDVSTGEDAEEGLISNLKAMTPAHATPDDSAEEEKGWQELRVKLLQLEQREKELLDNMEPSHPSVVSVRKEIQKVQASLAIEAEIQLRKLKDRHAALTIQLNALETAEYQWQAKNLLASQRSGELKRIAAVVKRYESNYDSLYSRLHNLRATEELKAGHFRIVDPVSTPQKPL